MKLGMTVLLAVALLGLGVLFGVIFWENEEGIGAFFFSLGGYGELVVGEGDKGSRWEEVGLSGLRLREGLTKDALGYGVYSS